MIAKSLSKTTESSGHLNKRDILQQHSITPSIVNDSMKSPGQPVEEERVFADPRLGHNFSRILVHAPTPAVGKETTQLVAESCPLVLNNPRFCPFGGACHTCPARVQTKLTVGGPDDALEQEADRVTEEVASSPRQSTAVSQVPVERQVVANTVSLLKEWQRLTAGGGGRRTPPSSSEPERTRCCATHRPRGPALTGGVARCGHARLHGVALRSRFQSGQGA